MFILLADKNDDFLFSIWSYYEKLPLWTVEVCPARTGQARSADIQQRAAGKPLCAVRADTHRWLDEFAEECHESERSEIMDHGQTENKFCEFPIRNLMIWKRSIKLVEEMLNEKKKLTRPVQKSSSSIPMDPLVLVKWLVASKMRQVRFANRAIRLR